MRVALVIACGVFLCSCTGQARIYPMDDASLKAGVPTIEFTRYGTGQGPVTITMPDGEILRGEFQVTENTVIGAGAFGRYTSSMIATGTSPVVIGATGDRGTIMNCEGAADVGGHGSGICQTNKNLKYRVMF
jgi:hypothetical protein